MTAVLSAGSAASPARLAAATMVLGFLAMAGGGVLWSTATTADVGTARHLWERGLLMAAIALTATGIVALAVHLEDTAAYRLTLAGALVYSCASILGLAHEAAILSPGLRGASWVIPGYVVLAFLGQATFGLGLAGARPASPTRSAGSFSPGTSPGWPSCRWPRRATCTSRSFTI